MPIFDVTPPGQFVQLSHMLCAVPGPADLPDPPVWTTKDISVPSPLWRVMALNSSLDFGDELRIFSDAFLAPAAIPPARRQYDTGKVLDMTELSIRFMGAGTDRLTHTVGISNGLKKSPSKAASRVPPKISPQGKLKRTTDFLIMPISVRASVC